MEESYKKAADKLGLGNRIEAETQLLASGFTSVNLEGIAPFDDSIASFDYQTNQLIKSNWQARTELHPGMFPGPLASIRKFAVEDGTLNFALKRSRFDIFDGLKQEMPSRLDITEIPLDRDLCLYLCTGAVTITAPEESYPDGAIIFGIRHSRHAIGPGNSNCLPSGLVNPDKDRLLIGDSTSRSLLSIRLTILRELMEETSIRDYKQLEYLGLVYEGYMAPGITIAVRLTVDSTMNKIRKTIINSDNESESYHFIANNPEAVRDFVAKYPPTPHSAAMLALHFATSS